MADVDTSKPPSLSEHYLLKGKEGTSEIITKPVEEADVKTPVDSTVEVAEVKTPENVTVGEVVVQKAEETPAVVENSEVPIAAAADGSSEASDAAAGESTEATTAAEAEARDDTPAGEEASENAESEAAGDQEAAEDTPQIKLETAPADFRFPTTNQTRHCFTRYIEYHRCIAAKGEDASECQKFAKYYRALCPGEWVDRWNEQRENGTFPGPL
ncbi:hypothetical protein ACH5RR_026925 [Cinchona calisaya]|uniref:Cytochrome c oxidase subunit 6b-1 n=1 Tax=Cinchona calisaya TaxID=153742 RepID=A0ABD2Z4Z9_9GENT